MNMKQILTAAAAASLALLALVGCGSKDAASGAAEPKDYAQIIHDARTDEYNEAMLILSSDAEGNLTAMDGPVADLSEEDLKAQADNFILPMLGLQEGDYERFAASVSTLNVRSYGVAIVQPAEGKAEDVQAALENYVTSQQLAMERDRQGRHRHHPPHRRGGAGLLRGLGRHPGRHPGGPGSLNARCSPQTDLITKSSARTTCAYGRNTYREMER